MAVVRRKLAKVSKNRSFSYRIEQKKKHTVMGTPLFAIKHLSTNNKTGALLSVWMLSGLPRHWVAGNTAPSSECKPKRPPDAAVPMT